MVEKKKPKLTHKFKAKRVEYDGIKFASTREGNYYLSLKRRQEDGEVLFFLRQVPFHLDGNVKYFCDFQVFLADGTIEFVDVKGIRLNMYLVKKKLVEAKYPIEIREVLS